MNVTCSAPVCPVILNSSCVFYEGESLVYTGINTNDSLQVALQKIDAALGLTTVVNIYNSDGVLTGNRNVLMNNFTLSFEKDVFIYNARVGRGAGAVVTNTVLGNSALNANTTGQYNTAVGISTLNLNTTGNYNTALGAYSLSNATTAEGNTGVGTSAMTFLTTGYSNTAVGFGALYKVVGGYQNVGVGRSALYELTSGNQNIGIGLSAGSSITTGSKNTIIGWGSGQPISTGSSNTIIGANVSGLAATTSNNIILSDGDGNVQFKDDGANTILPRLAGAGTRMVVAGATGALSSQAIPTGNITGTGANGQVAYWTGASTQAGSNNLFYDVATSSLGVGTNTPAAPLDVRTTSGFDSAIFKSQYTTLLYVGNDNTWGWFGTAAGGGGSRVSVATQGVRVNVNGTEYARFGQTGNLMLQNGGTFIDGGQRLQVIGDTLLRGSGNTNSTLVLTAQNSDSANVLRVFNGGSIGIGSSADRPIIFPFTTAVGSPVISGTNLAFYNYTNTQSAANGAFGFENTAAAQTSGQNSFMRLSAAFVPTSGTGSYTQLLITGTINQTGGANGVIRGLHINPTLTAAADWRAIEVSAGITILAPSTTTSASLRLPNGVAPTTPTNGDIWSTTTDLLARINGVTYSLINSGLSGSGAAGQVTFWSSATNITGSNNFAWNNASNRLDLNGTDSGDSIRIINRGYITFSDATNTLTTRFRGISTGFIFQDAAFNTRAQISTGAGLTYFNAAGGGVMIGTSTDLAVRLGVSGETLLRGSGNAAATTALSVQNSDSSNMLQILNNGYIRLGNLGNSSFRIYPSTVASGGDVDLNGEFLTLNSRSLNTDTGSAAGFIHINGVSATPASGIQNVVSIQKGFAPTSGNAVHTSLLVNPLINQGGGANGVTRGLYVNPTLTAAADFRAIEWSNNAATAPAVSWGLYGAGTAPNYLAGDLRVNQTGTTNAMIFASTTSRTNVVAIRAGGSATQSTSMGFFSNQTLNSANTAEYTSFSSNTDIAAGTYTIPIVTSYFATSGTKPAGVTITNMYGFFVESTLIQGTNNYGFYGNIAAATGRWNLYMNGTAANYLNGSLLIGSATDDGINKLQVTGSISATTNSTISGLSVGKGAGNVATNTALGASALITNSTGAQNTAVGNEALRLNTTGLQNSAFGYRASRATTTGSTNSAFGIDALRVNTTGNNNAAFGAQALDNNTAGNNTAIGTNALLDNTSGVGNTALGYRAGFAGSLLSNITGSNNIFIGSDSIGESISESNRTFIGNTSTTSTWLGGRLLLGSRTDDAANRLQVTGASALVGTTYVNTNASIGGYNHSLQVLANAAGGMIVSTTNTASGIGIVNSSSANKTWDISPFGNNLAINESGSGSRMYFLSGGNITVGGITNSGNLLEVLGTFRTTGVNTLSNLGGVGSRMVVADANGVLSTQAIPGGTLSGSGVAGQVTYWSGASSLTGDNNFFWDAANGRLGIGTNTPAATRTIDILTNLNDSQLVNIRNNSTGTSAVAGFQAQNSTQTASLFLTSTGYPTNGVIAANTMTLYSANASNIAIAVNSTGYFSIGTGNVTPTEKLRMFNNGNILIQDGGVYNDGGQRLQVTGRAIANNAITQGTFPTFGGNRIGLFGAQSIDVPTTATFNVGTVNSSLTGAQYLTFNGNTTVGGDALLCGGTIINSVQFATTGTVTMNNSAAGGQRTMSVLQLQMQKAGTVAGTVTRGSTLYLFGVYPTTSTGGTVTFTEYAGLRIGNLTEWAGGSTPNNTVVLTNKWGIYQEGDTDPNYFAGSVGIGVATNNASAKLQVDSTTQGFLPPRMTNVQMNAIVSPAAGLIVYNTTDNKHYGYNGTTWNAFY